MFEGLSFFLDGGIDGGKCFKISIGGVALMQCQQRIYPQVMVALSIFPITIQPSFDGLVARIGEIYEKPFDVGEGERLVKAELICLGGMLQCIDGQFFLKEASCLRIITKVFQVLHH